LTTEQEVVTDAPTENSAPEVTDTPEVVTQEAPESAGEDTKESEPASEGPSELEVQLKEFERKLRKAERNNAKLYAKLTSIETQAQEGQTQEKQSTDSVEVRAEAMVFTKTANALVKEGKSQHADYMDVLSDLRAEVGEFVQPNGLPTTFMKAVLEVVDTKPEQTKLLYHLGKNPELAEELADLSPYQLAIRLDRIKTGLAEKQTPKISNAPKPLVPVKAQSSDSDLGPNLSDQEWLRRREAQLKAARG
jgi:hypothetical protein